MNTRFEAGNFWPLGGLKWRHIPKCASRGDSIFATIVFILAFTGFRWGWHLAFIDRLFGSSLFQFFQNFQLDSDLLIANRINESSQFGLFSNGFSLGQNGSYTSQVGFGGWIITFPQAVLHLNFELSLSLAYTFVAVVNACIATLFLYEIRKQLSLGAAVVALIALLQPWPIAISHSVYWFIGMKVLPAVVLAMLLSRTRFRKYFSYSVLTILCTLTFMSGYEYATIVAALIFAVVVFHNIKNRNSTKELLADSIFSLTSLILAFCLALAAQVLQLFIRSGSIRSAIDAVQQIATKRTGATSASVESIYAQSLAASPSQVLETYLPMPLIGAPGSLPIFHYFTVTTLIICVGCVLVTVGISGLAINRKRTYLAFGMAWLVSLLGPIGWFLLARPHSYIHTHINFSLWFFPVIPLGLAILWIPIRDGLTNLLKDPGARLVVLFVGLTVVVFYIFSLLTKR